MKIRLQKFCSFYISFFSGSDAFAQTGVGKLSGKIVDAATREPLIGANVILVGTSTGAATDVDGNYFILNITPGTYELKVTYVGYAPKTLENIRVVAGITYDLNIELTTDFTLDEIVVVDRKFLKKNQQTLLKLSIQIRYQDYLYAVLQILHHFNPALLYKREAADRMVMQVLTLEVVEAVRYYISLMACLKITYTTDLQLLQLVTLQLNKYLFRLAVTKLSMARHNQVL